MKTSNHFYRQLLAATVLVSGALSVTLSVLANGTPAGTVITNTATADYQDPNAPGVILKVFSNTAIVTVAEVAGMTLAPQGMTDVNGGQVAPGDSLYYDFLATNVGNDPTQFFIPGSATVTGPGTIGTVQISTNGGTTYTNVPAAGTITIPVLPDGSVRVRVPVTVNALATPGATIAVVLGNTGANDNSAGTQNQPYPTAPSGLDVYTVDTVGSPGEAAGAPINGEREASATETTSVQANSLALAAVLLDQVGYDTNGSPLNLADDLITYSLTLRTDATTPPGSSGITPGNLVGTPIKVNGSTVPRILVADALPPGTVLAQAITTVPPGWTAVYTIDPTLITANNANWVTTPPALLTTVTRVGFINTGPIIAGSIAPNLSFVARTSGIVGATSIANMAQVFGQTAGDALGKLVYDESGDQTPDNFNDDGTAGSLVPTTGVVLNALLPVIGTDPGNNTGTGPGGEANVFQLTVADQILNGPLVFPAAIGPTDGNDDFTDRSAYIAGYTPGSTLDPAPVPFLNAISNPGTAAYTRNVLLTPVAPTNAADLPTGTTVTLTVGLFSAVYTYNGTQFTLTAGLPIQVPGLLAAAIAPYTTTVNLPAGTPLSTDTSIGYPVTIQATVDSNGDGTVNPGEPFNRTIDKVYTGFLKLVKQTRVLQGTGPAVSGSDATFSTTPKTPAPGNILVYRVAYSNIADAAPPSGSGNVILRAATVAISEDGTSGGNTWALDSDANGSLDTGNVVGSASDPNGVVTFFAGNPAIIPTTDIVGLTAITDVTKYVDIVPNVDPGQSGSFTFQRRIR